MLWSGEQQHRTGGSTQNPLEETTGGRTIAPPKFLGGGEDQSH